ncbi:MAG: hypothetical protein R2911_37410 [Caldilineaceae bacterium]
MGATHIRGGALSGNSVRQVIPELVGFGAVTETTFVVSATGTITNSAYSVSASGALRPQARGRSSPSWCRRRWMPAR